VHIPHISDHSQRRGASQHTPARVSDTIRFRAAAAVLTVLSVGLSAIVPSPAAANGAPAPIMSISGIPQLGRYVTVRFDESYTPVGTYFDIWVCGSDAYAADRRPDDSRTNLQNADCRPVTFWSRGGDPTAKRAVKWIIRTTEDSPALNPDDGDADYGDDISAAAYCGSDESPLKDRNGVLMVAPYYLIVHDFSGGGHSNWFGPIDCDEVADPDAPLTSSGADGAGPTGPTWIPTADGTSPTFTQGMAQWQLEDGGEAPLVRTSAGPGTVRYQGDGIRVTFTGAAGTGPTTGLVADTDGNVECEICAFLASGGVIEAWMFSEPRLVAAWRVEDLPCQRFTIPVGAPLDGGGPIPAGLHTLQLVLPTTSGLQAVNVGVTFGGRIVPTSVRAGGGSDGGLTALSSTGLLIAALVAIPVLRRRRATAG
jgi:hypothetical protein